MTIKVLSPEAAPLLDELRTADWLTTQQYKQIENLIARNEIDLARNLFNDWRP
jgi:hypothetical protein